MARKMKMVARPPRIPARKRPARKIKDMSSGATGTTLFQKIYRKHFADG